MKTFAVITLALALTASAALAHGRYVKPGSDFERIWFSLPVGENG